MMVNTGKESHMDDNILNKERGNTCRCYETRNNLLYGGNTSVSGLGGSLLGMCLRCKGKLHTSTCTSSRFARHVCRAVQR